MKNKPFENFDFIDFWDDDEYAMNEYIGCTSYRRDDRRNRT